MTYIRKLTPEEKIKCRIACPEADYPDSEARFLTEEEFWKWYTDLYFNHEHPLK